MPKITELPSAVTVDAADQVVIVDVSDGTTKKANASQVGPQPGGTEGQVLYKSGSGSEGDAGLTINATSHRPVMANGLELTNGANTMVVDGAPTAPRTITLPNVTDTLVGLAAAQTLTNKTISGASNTLSNIPGSAVAPNFGAQNITTTGSISANSVLLPAFTSTIATSADGKVTTIDAMGSAQTADATQTTAFTSPTLADEAVHRIDVLVEAIQSTGAAAASYSRRYAGRRAGGTWTELAAVSDTNTEETSAAWDVTVDVSSDTFRVRVTGAAATTIRWGVRVSIMSTVP